MKQVTKINTPTDVTDVVIFVHGFGVRWDSRGMFTDIAASLHQKWGSVLFDFYETDGDQVYVTDIDTQISRLKTIVSDMQQKHADTALHLIAHSMGCIIAAKLAPSISGKVIFLAPPESFGAKIEDYFMSQPGAKVSDLEIIVPRKDSTFSHIPRGFFSEVEKLNCEEIINSFAQQTKISLLQTTHDEVIGTTRYASLRDNANIAIQQMPADHNFTDAYRQELIGYVNSVLY